LDEREQEISGSRLNQLDGRAWLRYSISVWKISKTPEEAKLKHPAMFPLEPAHARVTSRLCNGPNQSSLNQHPVDGSTAYGCSSFIMLPRVTLNLAWSPMLLSPKLRKWIHCDLGSRMCNASGMRLCCQIFRPIFTKDAPPPVNSFSLGRNASAISVTFQPSSLLRTIQRLLRSTLCMTNPSHSKL